MFCKDCIPDLYNKFVQMGYTNYNSENYIWLFEMEWMQTGDVVNYEYDENESMEILPFAFTGHGDKWVFVNNNTCEPYIGLCYSEDTEGFYYAKNFEDAIMRNILDYVSSSSFYVDEKDAESYQMCRDEFQFYLEKYSNTFAGLFSQNYIELINSLRKKKIKKCNDSYCEWYALLSLDEVDEIMKTYLDFSMMNRSFPSVERFSYGPMGSC